MSTPPKPFPLYTDGAGVFFTTDGVTFTQLGGGAAGSIPLSELAHQGDRTVVGNVAGSSASPVALTATQLTALVNPATGSLPGAMTAAQFSTMLNSGAGLGIFTYSADVDITQIAATRLTPTIAGFGFVPIRVVASVLAVTGTATSGLAVSAGNNSASYNNAVASASFPAIATINAGAAGAGTPGGQTSASPAPILVGAALPFFVNVTTGVSGATVCSVRYSIGGFWTPVSF